MYDQLSKSDKRIARAYIEKGVDAEFKDGLERFEMIFATGVLENFPATGMPIMNCLGL